MPLTSEEERIRVSIGFDLDVCLLLKPHGRLEHALFPDDRGELEPGEGISIAVADGDAAEKMMDAIQPELSKRGYRAFWSTRRDANGRRGWPSDEVIILKTTDPYAIARLQRTDGANYDISTSDILDRLSMWTSLCRFDVVGANHDWVALKFITLPERLCSFAEEVYLFCPDTVDQGVGLKDESDDPGAFEEARHLCPEVSDAVHRRLRDQASELSAAAAGLPEELRALLGQAMPNEGPGAEAIKMGVRLLAREIARTKYLFLWWD